MPNWRIYFNRKAEAPQVWSVDEGTQASESNVINWETHHGTTSKSHTDLSVKVNPDTPTAWLIVPNAIMVMRDGVAHFYPDFDSKFNRVHDLP